MPGHDEEAIETTKAGDSARDRSRRPPLAHQLPDDLFEGAAIERLYRAPERRRSGREL